jgi:DNA-binding LacI/PurR family transcriptional regulator
VTAVPQFKRAATLRDVAEAAGLSVASVSYALRGLQTSVGTQARVRRIADDLGYRADPIARALASGRSGTVGVVMGTLEDLWMQRVAAGISRALLARGLFALLVDAGADPAQEHALARQLVDQRVDALVVSPIDPSGAGWAALASRVPIVTVGDSLPGVPAAGEVLFDNRTGVTQALEHLGDHGHRCIALITTGRPTTPDRPAERHASAEAARLGMSLLVIGTQPELPAAADAVERVLAGGGDDPGRPTALLALSDTLAHGCYLAARRLGWSIPGQISVVGYDDQPVSALLDPPLTTVGWDEQVLTDGVADAVAAALAPPADGAAPAREDRTHPAPAGVRRLHLVLAPQLLRRRSVGPPAAS